MSGHNRPRAHCICTRTLRQRLNEENNYGGSVTHIDEPIAADATEVAGRQAISSRCLRFWQLGTEALVHS